MHFLFWAAASPIEKSEPLTLPAEKPPAMRYFVQLSYKGTRYFGWQKQSEEPRTVQAVLEKAFSTLLNTPTEVTGCGRTDAGVHARKYYLHFDAGPLPHQFQRRLNKFLPEDIAVHRIFQVHDEAHARYDAYSRSYEYHLIFRKDPFSADRAYFYPFAKVPDFRKTQQAAQLLLRYEAFAPFCKSHSGAQSMVCELSRSEWVVSGEQHWVFHITANRFLRGMVRLIVGMCLNVGLGKVSLEQVQRALDRQSLLEKSWSVPPQGLFLTDVKYPFFQGD